MGPGAVVLPLLQRRLVVSSSSHLLGRRQPGVGVWASRAQNPARARPTGGGREGGTHRTNQGASHTLGNAPPLAPGIEEMEASFWHLPRYMVAAGQNSTSRVEEGGMAAESG